MAVNLARAEAGAVTRGAGKEVANEVIVALDIEAAGKALLATARGGRDWDHSALVRALEMLAGHAVGGMA